MQVNTSSAETKTVVVVTQSNFPLVCVQTWVCLRWRTTATRWLLFSHMSCISCRQGSGRHTQLHTLINQWRWQAWSNYGPGGGGTCCLLCFETIYHEIFRKHIDLVWDCENEAKMQPNQCLCLALYWNHTENTAKEENTAFKTWSLPKFAFFMFGRPD